MLLLVAWPFRSLAILSLRADAGCLILMHSSGAASQGNHEMGKVTRYDRGGRDDDGAHRRSYAAHGYRHFPVGDRYVVAQRYGISQLQRVLPSCPRYCNYFERCVRRSVCACCSSSSSAVFETGNIDYGSLLYWNRYCGHVLGLSAGKPHPCDSLCMYA